MINTQDYHKDKKKLVTLTAVNPPARFGALQINNGIIILDQIQLEGKNKISGSDFARGYQLSQKINNEKVFKILS